jgi:hypothetical protein
MCQKDRRDADRLESRRNIIRKEFIPAMRGDKSANPSPDDLVWVELDPFLQFMSCRERQSSRVGDQPRPSPLCSHKTPGLHPRVARRGKLIPKVVFDLYVAASLAEDQRLESDASEGEVHESIAFDKIVCPDCSREYLSELSEKLKRIRGLKYLYEELNPKELTFKLEYGPDDEDENVDAESKFGYAVSRKFITWFRGKFAQVLKKASVSMAEAKVEGDGLAAVESFARSSAEGLDGIDLLEFESSYIPSRSSDNADEFTVNKHITCTFSTGIPTLACTVYTRS